MVWWYIACSFFSAFIAFIASIATSYFYKKRMLRTLRSKTNGRLVIAYDEEEPYIFIDFDNNEKLIDGGIVIFEVQCIDSRENQSL